MDATRRDVDEHDPLALTLGSIYAAAAAPPASLTPKPQPPAPAPAPAPRSTRRRLNESGAASVPRRGVESGASLPRRRSEPPRADDGDAAAAADGLLPAPFPWATERPAHHDTLESLLRRGVTSVEGEARCKRCGRSKAIAYDLEPKFREVRGYIAANRHAMDDRAPEAWMVPALPDCEACGSKGCLWPVIAAEKREINWLFLMLGQMLGCCTLEQLKYFCKNTRKHCTGAKNRVLYDAYIEICSQLEPFDEMVPKW
ncbi:hypothetical protein ACP70R_038109 [Stipagrostis hirtigluma subsp. patula]